ncbi:MAG: beta-ketoacyl-[acyl-carrier-protein] synthase family protein [Deltaproteobacteria bacterium]|nr:beta-ketoacyl-[acyl-carrier-protein] synthase family protein [Deltaproteobacteria bacterium]
MDERVVVTGLGLATALGIDVEENWRRLLNGVSGIRPLTLPQSRSSPIQAAGRIDPEDLKRMEMAFAVKTRVGTARKSLFARWAVRSALKDADLLSVAGNRNRWGLFSAEGIPTISLPEIARHVNSQGRLDPVRVKGEHNVGGLGAPGHMEQIGITASVSEEFGIRGPNVVIMSACASATQAIGLAFRAVRRGDADVMVAGGTDSMVDPVGLMYFVLLSAASVAYGSVKTACRPFDRKRNGLVVGEGAGYLVLEALSHAQERGARIYAEMVGYGSTLDAFRLTAPDPRGMGAARAMLCALRDAGLETGDVDYINAHGTGTRENDICETLAIKAAFRDKAAGLSISSSKSMIGHLMAAAGGPECIYTVLTVHHNEIHPTRKLRHPDPKCDLDYVPNIRRKKVVRAALSNSFGFGGQNATIAVKKFN